MNTFLVLFLFEILTISLCSVPINYVASWPRNVNPKRNYSVSNFSQIANGPLYNKAISYDIWNAKHHHPYYGGMVSTTFENTNYSKITEYWSLGDSAIWTGTYLASQAMRFYVTKDPQARINIIKNVFALHGYIHVTNASGYIARYHGPMNPLVYKGDEWCKAQFACHRVTEGIYKGDFWMGDTTKDQYSGWFYGMSMAYDALENNQDEDIRELIRNDVKLATDRLIRDNWIIHDEKGFYHVISAGQRPVYIYQVSWLTVAYHMTGDVKYKKELESRLTRFNFWFERIGSYAGWSNKYMEYYANNLAHTSWYNLLRLGKEYFSDEAYNTLRDIFTDYVHNIVKLSHNPWFNAIFMTQGRYAPYKDDPYQKQYLEDMLEFREAPNWSYSREALDPKTYTVDIGTGWLKFFPKIQDLLLQYKLGYRPQASQPSRIKDQCYNGFFFQKSPFNVNACGANIKTRVEPGHDYLAAYWIGVFHGIIDFTQ